MFTIGRNGTHLTTFRSAKQDWALTLFAFSLILLFGLKTPTASAQDNPLESIGIPQLSGQMPVPNGQVNVSNGNMHLEIPLADLPQRGSTPSLHLALTYDSNFWSFAGGSWWGPHSVFPIYTMDPGTLYPMLSGWSIVETNMAYGGLGSVYGDSCYIDGSDNTDTYSDFYFTDSTGQTHTFSSIETIVGNVNSCGNYTSYSSLLSDGWADDGSGYHLYANGASSVVYDKDGNQISLVYLPFNTVKDSNGNSLTLTSPYTYLSSVDTLGRSPFTATLSGSTLTLGVLNAQGTTSNYVLSLEAINVHTAFGYGDISGATTAAIQSILLPNGASYNFTYDSGTASGNYGQMTSMQLPAGGTIVYSYTNFADSTYAYGPYAHITRPLSTMTTPDGTWNFTPAVVHQCTSGDTADCEQTYTIAKPSNGGRTDHIVYTTYINNLALPIQADYYTGSVSSGNLVASLTDSYDLAGFITKISSTASLPTVAGAVAHQTTQYCYDYKTGNMLHKWEWNFYTTAIVHDPNPPTASGGCSVYSGFTPDRTTDITYLGGSNYITSGSASVIRNITDKPNSVTVTNAGGGLVSKTLYSYDSSVLVTSGATGIVQHDDTNYSSSFAYRGNATQIQKLVSGTSTYLTKSMTYDITGQMRTETDWSNSNSKTYDYGDNFFVNSGTSVATGNTTTSATSYTPSTSTNAYVHTITYPTVSYTYPTTFSTALVDTFGYYWGTGQKARESGFNTGETTYYNYYDSLNRPTSTFLPNSGWAYNIYATSSVVQVDSGIGITSTSISTSCSSANCRHDQVLLDGLGRASSQELVSDPDGATTVATTYDSNGRVYSVSSPYRSGPALTEEYAYDGLDRKTIVTRADGSIASSYYGADVSSHGGRSSQLCSGYGVGYPILTVDEALAVKQTWTDGFGRLIEVDEPDPSTNSLTSGSYASTCYSYDLDGNLTGVTQGSETRTFTYDYLSRLTSAINTPEMSGTTNYYYTTSGGALCSGDPAAVCRHTDPVGSTTTYTYDVLNRLTATSYSAASPAVTTPAVQYGYDGGMPSSCTLPSLTIANGNGRRTSMCETGVGATAWSYYVGGNVAAEARTTGSYSHTFSYRYNYDNTLAAVTYPSSRTITYTPTSAQRISAAADTANSINYATNATYSPFGSLTSVQNGANLVTTKIYNGRGQQCRISVKSSGTAPTFCIGGSPNGNVLDLSYDFNSGYDNGNVMSITNNIDSTRSQTFSYDSLNRIATADASTYSTSPTHCWGESFVYDRYGNMSQIARLPTSYTSCSYGGFGPVSMSTSHLNQFTTSGGYAYDNNGNMTVNPSFYTTTYDVENRITSIGGGSPAYSYDGDGKRVTKGSGISGKLYWYGGNAAPLLETDGTNSNSKEYIFFGGQRIASRDSSGNVSYYVTDHLGTARVVTNASGTIQDDSDFEPFGYEHPYASTSGNDYKFTGKERDAESGLDYFGARYFSSSMGRFSSPDPSGLSYADPNNPQSLNLYAYSLNNPMRLIDPSGLTACYDNGGSGATSDNDPDRSDFYQTDNENECSKSGGVSLEVDVTVNVNADNSGDETATLDGGGSSTLIDYQTYPGNPYLSNVDPNQQRITSLVQGVAVDTAAFPTICSVGISAQLGVGPVAVGYSYDSKSGGKGFGNSRATPGSPASFPSVTQGNIPGGDPSPFSANVKVDTNRKISGSVTVRDPYSGVGVGVSVDQNGTPTVSASVRKGPATVAASATLGSIGDPKCQRHQ